MAAAVETEMQALRERVAALERQVSSIPPAHDVAPAPPPVAAKSGWRSFIDDKLIITGVISLVGIWATIYTNGQQLELETVKYQLDQYFSADNQADRIDVLVHIQDAPYTSVTMKSWARKKKDELTLILVNAAKADTQAAEKAEIRVEKIERGEGAALTPQEERRVETAGERAAQAVKTQIAQGAVKKPAAAPAVSQRERARALWTQGYDAYKAGDYARAEELYQSSHKTDPSYAPAVNSLGNIALLNKEYARAERLFRSAAELNPNYAPAAYNLVLALNAQKRGDDAKAQLDDAVRVSPNYALRKNVEATLDAPHPAAQLQLRLE